MKTSELRKIRKEAYNTAGYRERYAMDHGTEYRETYGSEDYLVYRYGPDDSYQDANGATYSINRRTWVD